MLNSRGCFGVLRVTTPALREAPLRPRSGRGSRKAEFVVKCLEHMKSRLRLMLVLLALGLPAQARLGVVQTKAGQRYEGQVRLLQGGLILANSAQALRVSLPMEALAAVSFDDESLAVVAGLEDVPAPWREADIGTVPMEGSTRYRAGVFTLRSAGLRLGETADSFHYVYQPMRGDVEIEARMDYVHRTHPSARAGLMIREDLSDYARHVTLALTPARSVALQWRKQDHTAGQGYEVGGPALSCWLRLKREGPQFTASFSKDRRRWLVIQRLVLPMTNETFFVGLASTSGRSGVMNWTSFNQVRTSNLTGNSWLHPRVELVSGSTVTGTLGEATAEGITLTAGRRSLLLPTASLARVVFQDWSARGAGTRPLRPGLLLVNGDFVDGDFQDIRDRKLRLHSLLYGPRAFDVESEILAVSFRPRLARQAAAEVWTREGAVWQADALRFDDNEVVFQEAALGEMRLPIQALREIRCRR